MGRLPVLLFVLLIICLSSTFAQQDATCSALRNCKSGCCSKYGKCGFGPEFCGDGCLGTCNAKAECGKYAPEGKFECPLSVCCSEHGFCGTTDEFCNSKCQNKNGCFPVVRKECYADPDAMSSEVRIAYYGVWGASRSCDAVQPENIPAGVLTHINVAFEYLSDKHEITDDHGSIVARTSRLKKTYAGLRVNIAIGGWVFNDPPTQHRFSNMVSTYTNRQNFIDSLIRYLKKYGLDGVDIDWEYPVADDRGGIPDDFDNFVLLCSEIKEAFNSVDPGWQLTITLPSSYWYLRGFDIERLDKHVDWFNIMTYDIHGLWDRSIEWTGPFLKGHTNLTEIEDGLDLLWRNGITPDRVVMGYGFYGRGFRMENPECSTPPNCKFSGASFPGDCSNEAGILSYSEIQGHKTQLGSEVFYDEESSVKWMIYGSNQWISFDDAESFKRKLEYQSSRCLKGLMIWSLDLDTPQFQAMTDLFGEEAMADALGDTSLNPKEKEQLVEDLAAYTGQNCYVTSSCAASNRDMDLSAKCAPGYTSVELGHAPWQISQRIATERCKKGEYHHVCCPTKHAPQNCEWVGAPEQSEFGCSRGCGDSQFELTTDSYTDFRGEGSCYSGRRSLCCDNTDILTECWWTDCGPTQDMCGDDGRVVAWRLDNNNGSLCKGDKPLRSYCCPKKDPLANCNWSNDVTKVKDKPKERWWADMYTCFNKDCPSDQLAVTKALIPHTSIDWVEQGAINCANWPNYPDMSPEYPLCCDPPSIFDDRWPVEPSYLWSDRAPDEEAEVTWEWANNFGNNNHDITPDDLDEDHGDDPYGFVMLHGPPGSINNAFSEDFTVVQNLEPRNIRPRSLLTSNQTVLNSVFENSEETIYVYCNHTPDSQACRRTFYKGAKDTIIRLPHHVGEGPWARIVSMEQEGSPELPSWVLRKRRVTGNQNGIYKLKFDYNIAAIQRDDDPVNMRVDYTNLKEYWDDITDEKVQRRSDEDLIPHRSFDEWRARLDRAKARNLKRENPADKKLESSLTFSKKSSSDTRREGLHPRWFGAFKDWLSRLNNVKAGDDGVLPMGLSKLFTLYSGRLVCENEDGVSFQAGLDVTADIALQMRTRYSYYFSGTIVPPNVIDTYAYVGSHPRVVAGMTITGDASLKYLSPRRKLIDTLTYPGLAIKGIAAVGPSLDVWGQIEGEVTARGSLRVGAVYTMKPIEMYMPNDDNTRQRATKELEDNDVDEQGLKPELEANVEANVGFKIHVTPETSLIDAHVSAFVNTTLNFYANVKARFPAGDGISYSYNYGVKFLYRVGFAAVAQIVLYGSWETKAYYPFALQEIDLYGPITVSSSPESSAKRSLPLWLPSDPLADPVFDVPSSISSTSNMALGLRTDSDFYDAISNGSAQLQVRAAGETEFKYGDFTCTTSNSARCAPDSSLVEETDEVTSRPNSETAHKMVKRAATDCPKKLPRLYYNCLGYFSDYTYTAPTSLGGTGVSVKIDGICSSVETFLRNWQNVGSRGNNPSRGTATSWTLSWDSGGQNPRRRRSCPAGHCRPDNIKKKSTLYGPAWKDVPALTNCDEFPFASAEEGGDGFYGLHPADPLGTTRTCVPTWQNDMQGQCNRLLNNIETNVNYFNDARNPTEDKPDWQTWGPTSRGWISKGAWSQKQRLSNYRTRQPPARGMSAADRETGFLSYHHKRNFTLHLAIPPPGSDAVSFPGASSVSGTLRNPSDPNRDPPKERQLSSASRVVCAVNLLDQQRYRFSSYNGICTDPKSKPRKYWKGHTEYVEWFTCEVSFTQSNTKRDQVPIEYIEDSPVYEIKRVQGLGGHVKKHNRFADVWEGGHDYEKERMKDTAMNL